MTLVGIVSGPYCHACRRQFERGERIAADHDRAYHQHCLDAVRAAGGIDEYRVAEPTERERKLEAELAAANAKIGELATTVINLEHGYKREKKRAEMFKAAAERATAAAMRGAAPLRPAPTAAPAAVPPRPVPPPEPPPAPLPAPDAPLDDPADRFRGIELD